MYDSRIWIPNLSTSSTYLGIRGLPRLARDVHKPHQSSGNMRQHCQPQEQFKFE